MLNPSHRIPFLFSHSCLPVIDASLLHSFVSDLCKEAYERDFLRGDGNSEAAFDAWWIVLREEGGKGKQKHKRSQNRFKNFAFSQINFKFSQKYFDGNFQQLSTNNLPQLYHLIGINICILCIIHWLQTGHKVKEGVREQMRLNGKSTKPQCDAQKHKLQANLWEIASMLHERMKTIENIFLLSLELWNIVGEFSS
jgi:hypothetical protein